MFDFIPFPDISNLVFCLFGIDDIAFAMVASAVISAVVAGVSSYHNQKATAAANEANIEAQEQVNAENREFTAEQNEITRQREDNALQRKVNDAQAAGLSPLAAISGQGASAAVPLNYSGQAGQVQPATYDTSGIVSALSSLSTDLGSFGQNENRIKDNKDARNVQNAQFYANLEMTDKLAERQRDLALTLEDKRTALKLVEIDNSYLKWSEEAKNVVGLENEKLHYKAYKDNVDMYAAETKASIDYLQSIGVHPRIIKTNNFEAYKKGKQQSINDINRSSHSYLVYLSKLSPQEQAIVLSRANAYGNNNSRSLGLKLGANGSSGVGQGQYKSASDWFRNAFGYTAGVDGSTSSGVQESSSNSLTFREADRVLKAAQFFRGVYVWQYVPDYVPYDKYYKAPDFSAKKKYYDYYGGF